MAGGIKIKVSTEEAQTATRKLREDLAKLGATSKLTEAQLKALEARCVNKLGMDKGRAAIDRLTNSLGLSKNEVAKFQQSLMPSTFMGRMSYAFDFLKNHWMGITIGIGVATMAAKKFADSIKNSALAGAKYETLGVSMVQVGKNANYLESEVMAFDEALQKTGISMLESRESIAKMIAAELDLTRVTELGRAAQHAATIGGINSSEAFGRMIQGIVSGEIEILKTMGIMVRWEAGYRKMEKQLGRSTNGLTAAEQAQSRLNTVLEDASKKAGVYESAMKTAGKQITSFPRYVSDFKVIMGQAFNPATNALLQAATVGMKEFQKEVGKPEVQEAIKKMGEEFSKLIISVSKDLPQAFRGLLGVFEEILPGFAKLTGYVSEINKWALIGARVFGRSPWGTKKSIPGIEGGTAGEISGAGDTWDADIKRAEAAAKAERERIKRENALKEVKEKQREEAAERAKSYPEEWKKIKADLKSTIETPLGEGDYVQYQEKLLGIERKYNEIRNNEAVRTLGDKRLINQAELVEKAKLQQNYDEEMRKRKSEGQIVLWELEKELTEATATELRKREMVAEDAAQKQQLAALKAYELGAIDLQGYRDKTNQIWENEKNEKIKINREYYSQEKSQYLDAQTAELDLLEATGTAHRETLSQRIDLLNQKIALETYNLSQIKELEDPSGYQQKTVALQGYNQELAKYIQELQNLDPKQAFLRGMKEMYDEYTDVGRQMYDLSREVASSMQTAFSDFFFDVMTGKLKSFGDYINSFLESVARSISNVLAQQAVAGIIDFGTSLFTGGGGAASYGGTYMTPGGMVKMPHSGGLPETDIMMTRWASEASFANAQRAHTGIGPEERPVIIRKDEGVFTKGQMAALAPAQPQNIKIEIKNESGEKLKVKESQTSFNPQEMVVTLWLDAWNRNAWGLRSATGV